MKDLKSLWLYLKRLNKRENNFTAKPFPPCMSKQTGNLQVRVSFSLLQIADQLAASAGASSLLVTGCVRR